MKIYGRSDKGGGREEMRENKENASHSLQMWATDAYVLEALQCRQEARIVLSEETQGLAHQ